MYRYFVVGDIHGCFEELMLLIQESGFNPAMDTLVSLGDLTDRGPNSVAILDFFCKMTAVGAAVVVEGNHDNKLKRYLKGNKVIPKHGLQTTLAEFASHPDQEYIKALKTEVLDMLEQSTTVLETEYFIAVHAAYRQGVSHKHSQNLNLYGEVDGSVDEKGFPNRSDKWKKDYTGSKDVLHGHIVVDNAPEVFTTITGAEIMDLDGGCVFGGELVGIMYPEKKVFKVKAQKDYHNG